MQRSIVSFKEMICDIKNIFNPLHLWDILSESLRFKLVSQRLPRNDLQSFRRNFKLRCCVFTFNTLKNQMVQTMVPLYPSFIILSLTYGSKVFYLNVVTSFRLEPMTLLTICFFVWRSVVWDRTRCISDKTLNQNSCFTLITLKTQVARRSIAPWFISVSACHPLLSSNDIRVYKPKVLY